MTSPTSTSRSCPCSAGTRCCSAGRAAAASAPSTPTPRTRSPTASPRSPLGGRRRMNRLHARIAVSEAAAWTARRFYGGRYRIIPNGVRPAAGRLERRAHGRGDEPLRILFIGQAVERKGLPVLLAAFEALREHIPATLTLVGAGDDEVAHMMLDGRRRRGPREGLRAAQAGRAARSRRAVRPLARRRELRHGPDRGLRRRDAGARLRHPRLPRRPARRVRRRAGARPATRSRSPSSCARWRSTRPGASGWRARRASAPSASPGRTSPPKCSTATSTRSRPRSRAQAGGRAPIRGARRYGLAPRDLLRPSRPSGFRASSRPARTGSERVGHGAAADVAAPRPRRELARRPRPRRPRVCSASALTRVATSLLASKPGLLAAGLALMCAAMFARAISLARDPRRAPTWRRARRRDAMQGTFIGVLMSSTLPARLGEPSRALIVARRIGRARETLPLVLGTMVSQTLLNLLALACSGIVTLSSVSVLDGHDRILMLLALAPLGALRRARRRRCSSPLPAVSRFRRAHGALAGLRRALLRAAARPAAVPRPARRPRATLAAARRVGAAVAVLLAVADGAFGLDGRAGAGAAAAVLFAVNVTAVIPATPANVGIFQAACVAVLSRRLPRLDPRRDRLRDRAPGG